MNEELNQAGPEIVELPEIVAQPGTGKDALASLRALHGVKVGLTVVVGQAHTTLGEMMALKEASVLKIDRQVDCPIDVVVDGSVVARGQLVVVDEHFGIRITEVAPQAA